MFRAMKLIFAALVLMGLAFGLVWAITRPQPRPRTDSNPFLDARAIQKIVTGIGKVVRQGNAEVKLSEGEINALTRRYFEGAWRKKSDDSDDVAATTSGPFTMESASVNISRDAMTLYFDFKYRGISVFAKFNGVPTLKEHHLGFAASSAKIGAIFLPSFVANRILARALNDPRYRKSLTMREEIRDVRIEKGDLVLTLARGTGAEVGGVPRP